MLPHVHTRAQHALFRLRPGRRLTAHEIVDLGVLLDFASRPHRHHAQWASMCGYDPEQVGTVPATNRKALSERMGLGENTETLKKRLARYEALGLADDRQGVIILRPNGVVRLDPHRADYETDAALTDGQPWPAVILPPGRVAARDADGALGSVRSSRIAPGSEDPPGILLPHRGDDVGVGGACAHVREPDPLDEFVTLAENVAQPLADGRAYRVTPATRNRLGRIVEAHGVDACRDALTNVAPNYAVSHPIGWLDAYLSTPPDDGPRAEEPAPVPEAVVDAVRGCIAPSRGGKPRHLSAAELAALAGLVERHGAEAVVAQTTADDGVGGYDLPVKGIAHRLERKRPARAGGERAVTGWGRGRRRNDAAVGRRVELTPEQEQAQREVDARRAAQAEAAQAAWDARRAQQEAEQAAERAEAERAAAEAAQRAEAARPRLRRKLAALRLAVAS